MRKVTIADLSPGASVSVGRKSGTVTGTIEHRVRGTFVHYRSDYNGGEYLAPLAIVRVQTRRRRVRGLKFAEVL